MPASEAGSETAEPAAGQVGISPTLPAGLPFAIVGSRLTHGRVAVFSSGGGDDPSAHAALGEVLVGEGGLRQRVGGGHPEGEEPGGDVVDQSAQQGAVGSVLDGGHGDAPVRYNQLAARVAGISRKMLTQTLRTLERDGLVARTVTPQVPIRVDYELTELGRTLMPVMLAVKQWAETHMDQVHQARERSDEATAG